MSNGPTSDALPTQIDPIRLAEEGIRLRGALSSRGMQRLSLTAPATIDIDLAFFKSAPGRWEMQGEIRAALSLTCQRCLAPLPWLLNAAPRLRFVRTEDFAPGSEADAAEVLAVHGPVRLAEWVEDEILLALPMIPLHSEGDGCHRVPVGDAAGGSGDERPHPFAALAKLKTQKR